jgi:hypothetical protein
MQASGIKPVIIQLVAQCLNELRRRLPSIPSERQLNTDFENLTF